MNIGKYVFAQVAEFIPRYVFDRIVQKHNGDRHSKNLNSYNHLLHLVFGQLTACTSLRDICLCLNAHRGIIYHLGFRQTVNESSLSRANATRSHLIFEELGEALIAMVRPMYSKEPVKDLYLPDYELLALDSTTISVSVNLCVWALSKYSKGAVKMHTALDLRGGIPDFILVTDGRWHDSNALDVIKPKPHSMWTFDKAYVDFEALYRMHRCGAYFVTRVKDNTLYTVVESNFNIDENTGLRGDHKILLAGKKTRNLYPEELRLVEYSDSGAELAFLTNNMEISALEVTNVYKNRWQIEVFFKWIKQNLTVKSLWGYSENAVRTHLWAAVCTYLLVARIKATYSSPYTVTEVATLISVSALEKTDLKELLASPEKPTETSKESEDLTLFD